MGLLKDVLPCLETTIAAARRETGRQRVLVLFATDREAPLSSVILSTSRMPNVTVIRTRAAQHVMDEFVSLTGTPDAYC